MRKRTNRRPPAGKTSNGASADPPTSRVHRKKSAKEEVTPEDSIQPSPGALNQAKPAEDNQGSPGDLTCETLHEDFEEVETGQISACTDIPDFQDPSNAGYPILVKSQGAFTCIDGWDLIEKARREHQEKIRCLVYHCEECPPLEMAIRKVAIRCLPKGGTCSYAELIRNVRMLERMLAENMENLVKFSHGGARSGSEFTGNRENDIRTLLANRLGKSRKTISNYLVHAEDLTDAAFGLLVGCREGKEFFEKAQSNRRQWVKILKSDGRSNEEISISLSEQIAVWLQEFHETDGKITPLVSESPEEEETQESGPRERNSCKIPRQRDFNHWTPQEPDQAAQGEAEIRQEIERISAAMVEIAKAASPLFEHKVEILNNVRQLAALVARIPNPPQDGQSTEECNGTIH